MEYFSHTMIIAWREFTFIFEDVCVLLELSCLGKYDICSIKLSEDEKKCVASFVICSKMSMINQRLLDSPIGLVCFFHKFNPKKGEDSFPEFPDHEYELEAFLIMWLARYVFLRCPDDGITLVVIPIAIKIAKRISLIQSLLPKILGSVPQRSRQNVKGLFGWRRKCFK